jgi:hypothetical protein
MKLKGFKSFVLKVCESKGVTDAFLRKYVNLKGLEGISVSFELSWVLLTFDQRSLWRPSQAGPSPAVCGFRVKASLPSGALREKLRVNLAITTEVLIPQSATNVKAYF